MPWHEATTMTERQSFIEEHLQGDKPFAELCREYEISRKTGYKWRNRFLQGGVEALDDRSRAPRNHPNETPDGVIQCVLEVRRDHPTWGPRKIVALLQRHQPEVAVPAPSTVGAILKRHGLVASRRRRARFHHSESPLTAAEAPNEVWCADYKGEFRLRGGKNCYPLTITDLNSRFLLRCQALGSTRHRFAYPVFLSAFREYGLPNVIRTDNGVPFAGRSPGGLTELSVWWIRLGIRPERIEPGHPQQNGSHERMHRTLKAEAITPRLPTLSRQQRRFNGWQSEFNELRPHESLAMLTPADCYETSLRPYPRRLARPKYEDDQVVCRVRASGNASFQSRVVYAGRNLVGLHVGLRDVGDNKWDVYFFEYLVGRIDLREEGPLRPRPVMP